MKTPSEVIAVAILLGASPISTLADGYLLWGASLNNGLKLAKSDGSGVESITATSSVHDVAVGLPGQGIFWTEPFAGTICRAELNGASNRVVVSGLARPWGISVDAPNEKVYWSDAVSNKIQRANMDGTAIETLLSGIDAPKEIELDLRTRTIYWVENGTGRIRKSSMDAPLATDVVTGLSTGGYGVTGMALDLPHNRLYWAENSSTRLIRRANLDGTGVTTVLDTSPIGGQPVSLAVDADREHVFWCNFTPNEIHRMSLDGSGDQVLLAASRPIGMVFVPFCVHLDVSEQGSFRLVFLGQNGDNWQIERSTDLRAPASWHHECSDVVHQTGWVATNVLFQVPAAFYRARIAY